MFAMETMEDTVMSGILAPDDVSRYQRIFELQEDGKWKAADQEIAKLDNRVLMGHVLYQRYMHPTKYRSKYNELAKWMKAYADHPGAYRVYRLARKAETRSDACTAPTGSAQRRHHDRAAPER